MPTKSLDVFSLRHSLIEDYRRFATSFTQIQAADLRAKIDAIYDDHRFWPEPLIQLNPQYQRKADVAQFVADGDLEPRCARIFRTDAKDDPPDGKPLLLYKHQQEAIAAAREGHSFVVTTGTGSGKSLCFFIPIVDAILREKKVDPRPRTRAIVIYPMNALANSQRDELKKYLDHVEGEPPVTFKRFTGDESTEARQKIAEDPPDIILTNFMMLELLMTRQDDVGRQVIEHCRDLRFLVLDELHTYRGRQGADVALLVRRVRDRLAPRQLQCIGTSATMTSDVSGADRRRVVAKVASKLFACEVRDDNVIVETLARATDAAQTAESVRARLGPAIDAEIPANISDAALRAHPLAIWMETRIGVECDPADGKWMRARPRSLTDAAAQLAIEAGRSQDACVQRLRDLLLLSSTPERERTGRPGANAKGFFAFKLHQFISGAGHAYSTLEPSGVRHVTVDGQQFQPGTDDKRLYSLHFCRECGHEYHPVRRSIADGAETFLARDIDDAPPPTDEKDDAPAAAGERDEFGFLTLHPKGDPGFDFTGAVEDYPDAWVEEWKGEFRIKSDYKNWRARGVRVEPNGRITESGVKAWFLPGRFRVCLRCGATQSTSARDRTRLASLSAEGRSSATTVLVLSALRWMHEAASGLDAYTRKILGFTDNRQDAALQAGHFNDFLFVSLLRAGFLRALADAGPAGLRSEEIGLAEQRALGFVADAVDARAEWLDDPATDGQPLLDAEQTLREILAYRVWFDQRRGWRYTAPNLEQLGLVRIEYKDLSALAANPAKFEEAPAVLREASPAVREKLLLKILDHLRTWMAIKSALLEQTTLEQVRTRSFSRLRAPWGFGLDEKPRSARWLFLVAPTGKDRKGGDDDLIVRGGARSGLGRLLRTQELWGSDSRPLKMKARDFDEVIRALLGAAASGGFIFEENTVFGKARGFRLNADRVVFRPGPGTTAAGGKRANLFFTDLYQNLADLLKRPSHPLFGFEARPHTAQVESDQREVREKRFRFGDDERDELQDRANELRQMGEPNRFLPVIFCSPTMELGVDIAALNTVYMRNVPPTPANYAQRSGRGGRSGQPALVLTYCSSQGPHDQYYFRDPGAMVHGQVKAPLIDLANEELVKSHLHAVWLACTEKELDPGIANLLVLNDRERPIKPELATELAKPEVVEEAAAHMRNVLAMTEDALTQQLAPWYTGSEAFAEAVARKAFDSFNNAFQRWRDLFLAAEQQRDAARRVQDDYSVPQKEKRTADSLNRQAIDQLNLLQHGRDTSTSDFFTYRYLATEGFLPGYNFPRLPLRAYVEGTGKRGKQTFVQRPRFLALSEFGPHSLIYHEGRAYRVVRAMIPLAQKDAARKEAVLPTRACYICARCGAGHFTDERSTCHACGHGLDKRQVIKDVVRIENVDTYPAERITANDEERKRQGFDLQTTFQWAPRRTGYAVRTGAASDEHGTVAKLSYGPGATITRLNKGLRRRANRDAHGFYIDPMSGFWKKNDAEEGDDRPQDPNIVPKQLIVPCVADTKNALLFMPADGSRTDKTLPTIQHALLRGIELVFQVEESEVLGEPMPSSDDRKQFLFYEATEGGAGVLTQLVTDEQVLARVAREALKVMHFALPDGELPRPEGLVDAPDTQCVAACYKCLMSYYNQPDHELVDRRDPGAREFLLRLARSTTRLGDVPAAAASPAATSAAAGGDSDETRWLAIATARGLLAPDATPLSVGDARVVLVWREHFVAASVGGMAKGTRDQLVTRGFEVFDFDGPEEAWAGAFAGLARALGCSA